ncbi:MAG TPA: hypothetical protein PLV68_19305 [Ilumatobacteraceae bacterium]|nr:hypothetical protein [Ilumatobacteraceae bacterium]
MNENAETARRQIQRMLEGTPFGPDDLADDAYDLVTVLLPRGQTALDAVSAAGLTAVGLPTTYPTTTDGERVGHAACWPAATDAYAAGLDGVHCRSAATLDGLGRELAWWPRDQTATWTTRSPYSAWRSSP